MTLLQRVRDLVRTLEIISENVVAMRLELQTALHRPPPSPSPAFVAVLVEASVDARRAEPLWHDGDDERLLAPNRANDRVLVPVTMGDAKTLAAGTHTFTLQSMRPLRRGRVTVFADLSRVDCTGVYVGTNFCHAEPGVCPVAHFDELPLGMLLRVMVKVS